MAGAIEPNIYRCAVGGDDARKTAKLRSSKYKRNVCDRVAAALAA
jgi:hypothetical protein